MTDEFETKIPTIRKSRITKHLNRQIPPLAHTAMYNWHKFWSRKTYNVVAEFIKTYCPESGIVFDPFAGSGVVAMEALKNNRRVIICDLLPISTEIIRLTIKPVSLIKLQEAYKRVEKKTKNKIQNLYLTKCRKCGDEFPITCSIWEQERQTREKPIKRRCLEIRYAACPNCGDRREKETKPTKFDLTLLEKIEKTEIEEWYPKQKLYHANGRPFMKKEKYESLDELFTKRNLQALAYLMEAIEQEPNRDLRDFLKIGFTSMVHLCSSLLAEGNPGYRPFSGVGWNQQSYWFTPRFMESNVWEKFESAVFGHQGLIKAKEESNKYFEKVEFASSYNEVMKGKSDIFIYNGSCFDLMKKMAADFGGKGEIDYIFTDPPYDASVQYGELAYLWVCWLKKDEGYLGKMITEEVIHNEKQEKNFERYHQFLSKSFREMFDVLKPDNWLTLTFHNPTFKVRNATIYAGVTAGFELEKIHHQELARPSAKSLLQPFGSAQGDFYLRFYKPATGENPIKPETVDEMRFEKIVVGTTVRILAERGEPTSYTIIINAIDPELARQGYFSELQTGLDVKTVLEKHKNKEFILVDTKIGGAQGKLWWFKDPSIVPHLQSIPLSERVEQTVLRELQKTIKVTFTDIWNAVSIEFPNSLTSDSMSIVDALKAYAKQVSGGYWMIKPNFRPNEIEKVHTTMIAILAEIGQTHGYKIWIGKIEQSHKITGFPNQEGELKQYLSFTDIKKLKNIKNPDVVEDIDLLWIKNGKVAFVFEVESTTSMTSGLQRGSNIETNVPKFLVLPEEREDQLLQKLKSPMFAETFTKDKWGTLYFGTLREEFSRSRGKTSIENLVNKKISNRSKGKRNDNQLDLFNSNSRDILET